MTGDNSCLAIDFSKTSGADAMLVMTGPGAPKDGFALANGTKVSFLFLTKGEAPTPKIVDNTVVIGEQTVSLDGNKLVLAK